MADANDSIASGQASEEELTIPRAAINKYIREVCPNIRVSFETREMLLQLCTEFIHVISSEANQICNDSMKKTITADHILKSLVKLGFSDYVAEAEAVLRDCKALAAKKRRKCSRLENLGIPEEDLWRQQQALFDEARLEQQRVDQGQWMQLQQEAAAAEQLQRQQLLQHHPVPDHDEYDENDDDDDDDDDAADDDES